MKTPIADFVKNYIEKDISRLHMPGHKGEAFLGFEKYDITEIAGADVLSAASGIIKESEENASRIFRTAHTFYSAQGSTALIYTMLALIRKNSKKTFVLAARNVHKAFINGCALLDIDVGWIMPENLTNILKCEITAEIVEEKIKTSCREIAAVYLTSPDYLGNIQNISEISKVCRRYGVPLLVDNAHGAYLKFLNKSIHPIDLGADICCDSAHKTFPVLTGGAYLHISRNAPKEFVENARDKAALFSSTSPSYLILQSLDLCNSYIEKDFKRELLECIEKINRIKAFISEKGFNVIESEPLKIVIDVCTSGYSGEELAENLRKFSIEPEFYDNDFIVFMLTPQNKGRDFDRLKNAFSVIVPKKPENRKSIKFSAPLVKMSIRDAVLAESEVIDIKSAVGRICASQVVSCPPAVPIAISGEEITKETIELFAYYGIDKIRVVKNI